MLVEYCVISGINVLLMLSGAFVVIASKHSLTQWRLNKPSTPQVAEKKDTSNQNGNANLDVVVKTA